MFRKETNVFLTFLVVLILLSGLNSNIGHSFQQKNLISYDEKLLSTTPRVWSTTELVSLESSDESSGPAIAVDSLGNIHVVWCDKTNISGFGEDYDVLYKKWTLITRLWNQAIVLSQKSTTDCWLPSIAIDSSNNIHVVWAEENIYYKKWSSSTSSWNPVEAISDSGSADLPAIAIDSTDKIHVVWKDYSLVGDIDYRNWDPITSSWSAIETISTETTSTVSKPSMAIDSRDNLHVVWPDKTNLDGSGTDSDIVYKMWNSSSVSWSTTQVVSTESTQGSWSSTLTIDSLENVHVVWKDYTQFPDAQSPFWSIAYKRWNSSSLSWTSTDVANFESTRYSDGPCIVADSYNNLHLVWQEDGFISTTDVLYSYWNSSSLSWDNHTEVTTETENNLGPALVIDSFDILYLTWVDYSSYANSWTDPDIFYKMSMVDSDGDGMPDKWEEDNELNPNTDDSTDDSDEDGLTNFEEYKYKTNPNMVDSDGDGYSDKVEIDEGTDPLNPADHPTETTTDDTTKTTSYLPIVSVVVLLRMGFRRRRNKK